MASCGSGMEIPSTPVSSALMALVQRLGGFPKLFDKPDNLPDVIQWCHEKTASLQDLLQQKDSDLKQMREKNVSLVERRVRDDKILLDLKNQLQEKEKVIVDCWLAKRDLEVEREQLKISSSQEANARKNLELGLQLLREKHAALEASFNQIVREVDRESKVSYVVSSLQRELKDGQVRIELELSKNSELSSEINQLKKDLVKLRTEKEAVERDSGLLAALARGASDLEDTHVACQERYQQKVDECSQMLEQLSVCRKERADAMSERDALLSTLYDRDRVAEHVSKKLHELEELVKKLSGENEMLKDDLLHTVSAKDDLFRQWELAKAERLQKQSDCEMLEKYRDELIVKLASNEKHNSRRGDAEKKQSELENRLAALSKLKDDEYEVVITRDASKNERFGVQFGAVQHAALVGQSNIVISGIDEKLKGIRVGDFVIRVNDVNVQECDVGLLREVCDMRGERMALVLRRKSHRPYTDVAVQLGGDPTTPGSITQWGVDLAVIVKHVAEGSYAYTKGLCEMDELLSINQHTTEHLSLLGIYQKMAKHRVCNLLVRRVHRVGSIRECDDHHELSGAEMKSEARHGVATNPVAVRQSSGRTSVVSSSATSESSFESEVSVKTLPRVLPRDPCSPPSIPEVAEKPAVPEKPSTSLEYISMKSYAPPVTSSMPASQVLGSSATAHSTSASEEGAQEGSPGLAAAAQEKGADSTAIVHCRPSSVSLGNYEYISNRFYNEHHVEVRNTLLYENSLRKVILRKELYHSFGFDIVGGNQTGIFIKSVENWSPASAADIHVGWRLLKINNKSLEQVAFCYAMEFLRESRRCTEVEMTFAELSVDMYENLIQMRPHDKFHVRALVDYNGRSPNELSFRKGDVLCVCHSYVMDDVGETYKWEAYNAEVIQCRKGLIPRQLSDTAHLSSSLNDYEEIGQGHQSSAVKTKPKRKFALSKKKHDKSLVSDVVDTLQLYELLDSVTIKSCSY